MQPVPKGQKREKEAWESLWNYGMFGGMAFATVLLLYKPDTRSVSSCIAEEPISWRMLGRVHRCA